MLSDEQLLRYQRQIFLDEINVNGQEKLLAAKVAVIGAGGLGATVLPLLVGAGVGQIEIWDGDQVDVSNLHRQTLYRVSDVGINKATAAAAALSGLNDDCRLTPVPRMLAQAQELGGYDLIVDCTDNLAARVLINRWAVEQAVSLVSGAAIGLTGQVAVYPLNRKDSPCWQCVFPELNEQQLNCREAGVLGPVVAAVGAMQAQLVILALTSNLPAANQLHLFDGKRMSWRAMTIAQSSDCPVHAQ
ncbi:HesA/MoeB/ThiF family protein [Salinibius halmophilus]|uniref:HesA/MoeB/ThiF family protein n=1 Tax=Salinibius halmophilus TaxID=1853216 RepID=UPI000E670C10|nr:HesA/MoeB/ThiF family protein [Salinibius halmophilus]